MLKSRRVLGVLHYIYISVTLVDKWSIAYLLVVSTSEMDTSQYFFNKSTPTKTFKNIDQTAALLVLKWIPPKLLWGIPQEKTTRRQKEGM